MKATKAILTLLGVCTLAAIAVQSSSAQPSGISITNQVPYVTNALWDVSLLSKLQNLELNFDTGNSSSVDIAYADPFTQSAKGKLAGSGTNVNVSLTVDDNGVTQTNFTGKYTTTGSVTASKGVLHVTFSSRVSGKTVFPDEPVPVLRTVSAGVSGTVKYDANNHLLTGKVTTHASASGLGAVSKAKALEASDLPDYTTELGDGTWTLQIDFGTADVNKLSGTASVTLSSGAVYPFAFTGVFNPKNNQSKLNLKGTGAGLGSSLQVTLDGTDIIKVSGRVAGQSVNIK